MKIIRFGDSNQEKPGIIDKNGIFRDASTIVDDWHGNSIGADSLAQIAAHDLLSLPAVPSSVRLGAPITNISKIIVIGLNYRNHAKEANMDVPTEPIMLLKSTSAVTGPNDSIELPLGSSQVDWEVELGVVIGKKAKNVSVENALSHVAGYTIANDVSERDWQINRGTQWTKGKCADTFCPLGPWLVTADEVGDPQDLQLNLWVNQENMQNGNTHDMVFNVADLVSRISHYTTLNAGDVMITGTPAGVGIGQKPPRFLKAGDHLRLTIAGLGEQNSVVTAPYA